LDKLRRERDELWAMVDQEKVANLRELQQTNSHLLRDNKEAKRDTHKLQQ